MATDIYIGSIQPTAFYVGTDAISEIYIGDILVYS